jgi:O-acetyl-ADP-ribose deacetylase (regulator of RNase III)
MPYIITPKHGNITDAKVDFAVNASNTRLILGSGVSMAFKRH